MISDTEQLFKIISAKIVQCVNVAAYPDPNVTTNYIVCHRDGCIPFGYVNLQKNELLIAGIELAAIVKSSISRRSYLQIIDNVCISYTPRNYPGDFSIWCAYCCNSPISHGRCPMCSEDARKMHIVEGRAIYWLACGCDVGLHAEIVALIARMMGELAVL